MASLRKIILQSGAKSMLVLAVAAAHSTPAAEIEGRVRVTTKLTKKRVSLPQIYERNAAIESPEPAPQTREDELRRVIIFLDSTALPAKPQRVSMNQTQRRFDPEIVAVPAGSTVSFPNSDPIFHNVFSLSKTKTFDLGNYPAGESRSVTFAKPGLVQVHCHLHPNMTAAILVTPNNWIVQPGKNGDFSLANVPPGKYSVVAWHKTAGFFRRTVEVSESGSAKIDFEIPLTETASHQHKHQP